MPDNIEYIKRMIFDLMKYIDDFAEEFIGAMSGEKEQSEINNQRINTIPFWSEIM